MAEVRILPDVRLLPPAQRLLLERNRLPRLMGKLSPYPEFVFDQCQEGTLMKEISRVLHSILGKVSTG